MEKKFETGTGGGGDERKQNFPKCLKVFVSDCRLVFYFLHFRALIIQKLGLGDEGN